MSLAVPGDIANIVLVITYITEGTSLLIENKHVKEGTVL